MEESGTREHREILGETRENITCMRTAEGSCKIAQVRYCTMMRRRVESVRGAGIGLPLHGTFLSWMDVGGSWARGKCNIEIERLYEA
jgi:hypothetical protein